MGKSTISMAIFNSYVSSPEGINEYPHDLPVNNGLIPLGVSGEAEKAQMLVPLLLWMEHLGAKIWLFLGRFPQKFWAKLGHLPIFTDILRWNYDDLDGFGGKSRNFVWVSPDIYIYILYIHFKWSFPDQKIMDIW